MKIYDNIFDKRFLDEYTYRLRYIGWDSSNIANRITWPYGERGTHRLMGHSLFRRENEDMIHYSDNKDLSFQSIEMFYAIRGFVNKNLFLQHIVANLQFMGMDGTNHTDVITENVEEYSYILMLSDDFVDANEGGEFVNATLSETVPYKYGRVVEIKTSDVHRGLAFTTPYKPRYSVKFVGKII